MTFQVQARCPQCGTMVGVIKRVFPRAFARHERYAQLNRRKVRCSGSWTDAGEAAATWLKERNELLSSAKAELPETRDRAKAAYDTAVEAINKRESAIEAEFAWLATVKP